MSDYLIKPKFRKGASMVKGDKYREGQSHELHVTQPLDSNAAVPEKSDELRRVKVTDDKVLAANEIKKEQAAARAASKALAKNAGSSKQAQPRGKCSGGAGESSLPSKKKNKKVLFLWWTWIPPTISPGPLQSALFIRKSWEFSKRTRMGLPTTYMMVSLHPMPRHLNKGLLVRGF